MSEEGIPVKLVVDEPEQEIQVYEFAQETIKIGRGRAGNKARKGVDVQLSDESVARVAAVIHVRKLDDVFIMDMGSGGTRIEGKQVGARAKLTSGTKIVIGNTQLTVYIGEDAPNIEVGGDSVMSMDEVGVEDVQWGSGEHLQGGGLPEEDLSTSAHNYLDPRAGFHSDTGENQAFSGGAEPNPFSIPPSDGSAFSAPQTPAPSHSAPPPTWAAPATAPPTPIPFEVGSFGIPASDASGLPQGYQLHPLHQDSVPAFGPAIPSPMPLPERVSGPNLRLALDVADRVGKEVWFIQPSVW